MLKLWLRRCDFAKRRFLQASPTRMQGFRSLHLSGVKFEVRCASEIALNSIIQITRFEPGSKIHEATNSEFPKFYETRVTRDGKELDGPHGPPPLLCHGGAVLGRRPGGR